MASLEAVAASRVATPIRINLVHRHDHDCAGLCLREMDMHEHSDSFSLNLFLLVPPF